MALATITSMHQPKEMIWYSHLGNLQEVAQQLLAHAGPHKIWLFTGELGAGKTTLIKAICTQLGIQDHVSSPTFALVHEYALPTGEPVYHLDAYRISNEQEALALDYLTYFDTGYYCFVEWPIKLAPLPPGRYFKINLSIESNGTRKLQASIAAGAVN